jgi:hypothetical protein
MRYYKDSSKEHNYRARFWQSMLTVHKPYRLYPFAFARLSANFYHSPFHYINLVDSGPKMWKYLYKYIPSSLFFQHWQSTKVFICSVLLFSLIFHFESRLWKEKKFDKEPGQMIPLRNRFLFRAYHYLIDIKLKPLLYYTGIWIQQEDLAMEVDIEQIATGRLYRRFLCLQYARKMGYSVYRNSSYDFLEVSENYGKD